MKLMLEKINKNLLLLEIVLLIFMNGSFSGSFIPKPFVIVFVIVTVLTFVDLIKNNKIRTFFSSISKKIWIALCCLVASVLIGWSVGIFVYHLHTTFNMLLEFGNFAISAVTFLLILFYSRNDKEYAKKCLYALLVPTVFVIFLLFPALAERFNLSAGGTFNGFTENVSYVAKMFLVPAFYFLVKTLIDSKNTWAKVGNFILTSAVVAMLFWSAERAEIIAFILGAVVAWFIISAHDFRIKKAISNAMIILAVFVLGFAMIPSISEKLLIDRVFHLDAYQSSYAELQEESMFTIFHSQGVSPTVGIITQNSSDTLANIADSESRLKIWPFYLKLVARNPLGYGPATHLNATVVYGQHTFTDPGTHNTYLETLLWGGAIGFLSFLYILYISADRIKIALQKNFNVITLSIAASMVGYAISIFFNDNIITTSVWIILALPLCLWIPLS